MAVLDTAFREEREIKRIHIGKEKVKFSLFADDMILYIEKPEDTTRKLLELINEYSKVAGYKINTQKSLGSLYTNNEKTEREIKETISFTIAMKGLKYLGIYLPKETKGGRFRFGNSFTLVVDSCQCMAKPIQYGKVKNFF